MILKVIKYPTPSLGEKSAEIGEITQEMKDKLIPDMVETMYETDGVGLAAPQIGKNIRLICLDPTGPKERKNLMVVVNPEIVESEGSMESDEGCLSVYEGNFKIKRANRVKVRGRNQDGDPVEYDFEGYPAVIFQHEIDHLDGVLIIDRISRLKRAIYDKKVKRWLKQGLLD